MIIDPTLHVAELLTLLTAGGAMLKGGLSIRDAVRDLKWVTEHLTEVVNDHEARLRHLEESHER